MEHLQYINYIILYKHYISIHPSIYQSIHPSIHLSINVAISPIISQSIHQSLYSLINPFVHPSIQLQSYGNESDTWNRRVCMSCCNMYLRTNYSINKISEYERMKQSGLPGLFDASVLAANLATASVGGGRSFTSLCSSCTLQAIFIRNLFSEKKIQR